MKKGSNDGKTIPHHICSPLIDDSSVACGFMISDNDRIVIIAVRRSVSNFDLFNAIAS